MTKFDWCLVAATALVAVVFAVLGMWGWCVGACVVAVVYVVFWMSMRPRSQS